MPSIVIKATPDRDLYCYWSSVVDCPVFIGTRAEMLKHLDWNGGDSRAPVMQGSSPEDRISRADETGTSALWGDPRNGAWEDTDGFIYMQQGWIRRARLADLLDRWLAEPDTVTEPDVSDLLEPFEDES